MSDKERKVIEYKKYQQGDVVMLKVNDDYFEKNVRKSEERIEYHGEQPTNAILAFGEVTGHKHQIHMKDMLDKAEVTLHMGYNRKAGIDVPDAFEVCEETVILTHEEHNPIELPPGKYMVRIVQEFDLITGRSRYVAD